MLNKGDTCYVRLKDGKIHKARYKEKSLEKMHRVNVDGVSYDDIFSHHLAAESLPISIDCCRFVCMSGMRKEYVEAIQ